MKEHLYITVPATVSIKYPAALDDASLKKELEELVERLEYSLIDSTHHIEVYLDPIDSLLNALEN